MRLKARVYCLRLLEDFVSIKVRKFQNGRASDFDYALLARVHKTALALNDKVRSASRPESLAARSMGLTESEVAIAPYDPAWASMFESEATQIREQLGPIVAEIHHIGSTSIPGLSAKPIIDIAVCANEVGLGDRFPSVVAAMEKIGYRYLGNWGGRGGRFFEKAISGVRSYAIQMHACDGSEIRRLLRFRQMLLSRPQLLAEYSDLKTALATISPRTRWLYVWLKAHWVNGLVLEDQGPRAWGSWWLATGQPTMLSAISRVYLRKLGFPAPHPMAT